MADKSAWPIAHQCMHVQKVLCFSKMPNVTLYVESRVHHNEGCPTERQARLDPLDNDGYIRGISVKPRRSLEGTPIRRGRQEKRSAADFGTGSGCSVFCTEENQSENQDRDVVGLWVGSRSRRGLRR